MEPGFVEVVRRHERLIRKVCRLYEDSDEDRKDLFQEIVYQLWRSYGSYRGEAKISTWVYRVALNTAVTALRRERTRPELVPLAAEHDLSADDGEPDAHERSERTLELERVLRRLTRVERGIVALYLEGLDYGEIAQTLGLTPSNVGVKLHRIRAKLHAGVREGT